MTPVGGAGPTPIADAGSPDPERRRWLAGMAAAMVAPASVARTSNKENKVLDLRFPQRLFATPILLAGAPPTVIGAGVFGATNAANRESRAVLFDARGREQAALPARGEAAKVNPGCSVLGIEPAGMLVIASDGAIVVRAPGGGERRLGQAPEIAMPVNVQRTAAEQEDLGFVTSVEFGRASTSRNAFAALRRGLPLPGYPTALAGMPEAAEPAIDWRNGQAFVALANGTVDGFDLRSAKRLAGFPVTLPRERGRPPRGHRIALAPSGSRLLVTMRTGSPVRIELSPAKPPRVVAPPAAGTEGLWSLATVAGASLLGFDTRINAFVVLDEDGGQLGSLVHPLAKHDSVDLIVAQRTVVCVGTNTSAEEDKVAELFKAAAPRDVQAKVADLAEQHVRRKAGGGDLSPELLAQRDASVREMMRSWLENNQGHAATTTKVQAEAFVTVQGVTVAGRTVTPLAGGLRIASMNDETDIMPTQALRPTIAMDDQRRVRGVVAGFNRIDAYGRSEAKDKSMAVLVDVDA